MTWIDDGLDITVNVSTAGDFVKLGKTTQYPFMVGAAGLPMGWTQYLASGGAVGDVSWTTGAGGRFSVGNLTTTDIHAGKLYGIYRDFPVTSGKRYLVQVQCRTTANRTTAIRYVNFGNASGSIYNSQVWSYPDWEQVSLYTGTFNYSTLRVYLYAAPYTLSTIHAPADANWGIQFQNVTIVEMDASYPDPTWHPVTCDVQSLAVHFGRDKFLNRYDVGTAQLTVLNNDGEFTYGLGTDSWGFRPGRFIQVIGHRQGTPSYDLFSIYYGVIDNITNGFTVDGKSTVVLSCVDVSSLLSTTTVPTYSDEGEYFVSGTRFRNLAYAAGWHPQYITYDAGVYTQQAILANGRTVRDELGLIGDSEGGAFYADRTGRLIYRDRNWSSSTNAYTQVQAELLATPTRAIPPVDNVPTVSYAPIVELTDIQTEWSRDRIVNLLSLGNQGGTAFVTIDASSQSKYGPRTYQRLDFLNDERHDEYTLERTQDIMTGYTDAILRVNNVTFRPNLDTRNFALTVFLNYPVRVRYEHPVEGWGFACVTRVQGFTQTWTPNDWEVTLTLDQPLTFTYWILSSTGWDAALWDVGIWDEKGNEHSYLNPTVGTVTTPDPGILPPQFTIVFTADGPIDTVVARMLVSQYESDPNRSWYLRRFGSNGNVGMALTPNGTNASAAALNGAANAVTRGTRQTIAFSVTMDNGAGKTTCSVSYFDPATNTWTAGGTGNINTLVPFNSNTVMRIGANGTSTTDQWDSKIYSVELRTGLSPTAGTVRWRFDAGEYPGGNVSSYRDPRGRTWTLTTPAAIVSS